MKHPNSTTHIVRHTDSLIDIIETDAFSLEGISLHCSFKLNIEEQWLHDFFNKAWERGVKTISFTDGKLLSNPRS